MEVLISIHLVFVFSHGTTYYNDYDLSSLVLPCIQVTWLSHPNGMAPCQCPCQACPDPGLLRCGTTHTPAGATLVVQVIDVGYSLMGAALPLAVESVNSVEP